MCYVQKYHDQFCQGFSIYFDEANRIQSNQREISKELLSSFIKTDLDADLKECILARGKIQTENVKIEAI